MEINYRNWIAFAWLITIALSAGAEWSVIQKPEQTLITIQGVVIDVQWDAEEQEVKKFKELEKSGARYFLGKTMLSRRVVWDENNECLFLHVRADQPGWVNLSVKFLTAGDVVVEDRRELSFSNAKAAGRLWVIPFESDVEDVEKGVIELRGEGEALIVLKIGAADEAAEIAGLWRRLGERFDPGEAFISPRAVWKGISGK